MSYLDSGYDAFMNRSIAINNQAIQQNNRLENIVSQSFEFDRNLISGSLGDKIQVGRILLSGDEGRITMKDENGVNILLIGEE